MPSAPPTRKLPVDPILPDLIAALRSGPCAVLEAPPGAGKTTRVPPALYDAGFADILVLEPRRLAARLAARRVAQEMGEPLGLTTGYQVRLESQVSEATRIRFLTEGVLTRRLLSDPHLDGVGCVVLDEFHERHLEGDVALALLRRLQQTARADLKLVVMSATLDGSAVAAYLGGCPVLRSEGRLFDLDIRYSPATSDPLESQIAQSAAALLKERDDGDILVFLPGAAEIRRAQRACAHLPCDVTPLHGDLSPEEQDCAVIPGPRRKIILSTNVAESSVTIEGVRSVIDSGLARVAQDSPFTGLPRLAVTRVSQASARQRAGRAGRTGPGRVVRLYPERDFLSRPVQDPPEILRRELSSLCLELRAAGIAHPHDLDWLDAPPPAALQAAGDLLERLNARGDDARRMAALPLHPRLARLALDAGDDGIALAACLSAGVRAPSVDLLALLHQPRDGYVRRVEDQIRRLLPRRPRATLDLPQAVLRAFPDRVARRRRDRELRLAQGGSAILASDRGLEKSQWMVAVEIEERPDQGLPLVRLASPIEPEWLLDFFPDRVREESGVEWNRQAERVETRSALLYDGLVLEESRGHMPGPAQAAPLLAQKALEAGLDRFLDPDEWKEFRARYACAAQYAPLDSLTEARVQSALESLCYGLRSFGDLRDACRGGGFYSVLLTPAQQRLLDELTPSRLRLPSGRTARVRYAEGQPPWVASRLQDFFGMKETPRIARGALPVVVHLLAPSQRPVQTTSDLAGFWQRLYPQLRRELSRRYPRHKWPEDPYTPE